MIYAAIAFFVVVGIVVVFQRRRGGPGPQVNYVPKALRPMVNARYRSRGWQEPFDADGNRNPDRGRL
jgi:hypothetical protein